ncbi:MAG: restriction endonuclease subunit S [Caldilineaceae bacterium]|nr:restriction endonuclease subunit S [Caldilineaceae bacterium]
MTGLVDLNPAHLTIVEHILAEHVPECEVRAFGSRAVWNARDTSDLDLAIVGEGPLPGRTLTMLKEAFEESRLPIRVDVIDWNAITDGFRESIEPDCMVVQKAPERADWPTVALGEVVELTLSSVDKKSKADEYPVLLCNYTDVYKNDFIRADMDFMPATAKEREIGRCSLVKGDVIITKDSEAYDDIGVPALVRDSIPNLLCGYHLAILRAKPEIDDTYLFYVLKTREVQQQFHAYANGVTRFGLRKADIGLVELPLPPLEEQRAIARVLGTLDDKIELNRRMSETLEEMARALFKSWFVDFDPVRAKVEGQLSGLPPDLDALFPESFEASELGEKPAGWEVQRLGELCHKPQYGYTQSAQDDPVGPKFLRITDINKGAWIVWDSVPYCEITPEDYEKYRLREGDVLIARMADPGHGCVVEVERDAVFASYLIRFRPLDGRFGRFLQYWMRSDGYWQLVRERGVGTTRLSLNAKILSSFPIVVPSRALLDAFGDCVEDLRSRVVTNTAESSTLAALRDALLPRLVSGELRVADLGAIGT